MKVRDIGRDVSRTLRRPRTRRAIRICAVIAIGVYLLATVDLVGTVARARA